MRILNSFLACVLVACQANAVESVVLSDRITAKGVGRIDLLKDLTARQLESLRADHEGELVFAVDINEAANGTEKASTQGVAIDTASLTLTYADGSQDVYTAPNFETSTMALLAPSEQTHRQPYFTLLGESGSSRTNTISTIQDLYDAAISFAVADPVDIRRQQDLVSADLDVDLLMTNDALGDPEAFYDFSAGFEDVAVINKVDRAFLDTYAAGRAEAPGVVLTNPEPVASPDDATFYSYFPDAAGYYLVAYEDLYPQIGDYDWNDLVVAYQVRYALNAANEVVSFDANAYLIARGAWFSHDWRLRMELPFSAAGTLACTTTSAEGSSVPCSPDNPGLFSGSLDVLMFEDTEQIFQANGAEGFTNTLAHHAFAVGPRSVLKVTFDVPQPLPGMDSPPFDPALFVRDTGRTVQLLEVNREAQDKNGYPFAMLMPNSWVPPLEGVDMRAAYEEFDLFTSSKGVNGVQWFNSPVRGRVKELPARSAWAW